MTLALDIVLTERRVNRSALARKVGTDNSHLRKIARGTIQPRVGLAIRIAEALEMSVEELFIQHDDNGGTSAAESPEKPRARTTAGQR